MVLRVGFYLLLFMMLGQGERISERKCNEYRNLTIKMTGVIPLVFNRKPIMVTSLKCIKTSHLITGGSEAKRHEFPHQAILGWKYSEFPKKYNFNCGGSLISRRYVLTAAHCFKSGDPDIVRLGEHNIADDTDDQVDFEIESTMRHPYYSFRAFFHDIALIKLKENVRFSNAIRPACLWTGHNIDVDEVIATGFGSLESYGAGSNLLRKVPLQFMDKQLCERQFAVRSLRNGLTDEQLCIGSEASGKDTCQGDSGGPIQILLGGCTYHIIAVTSLGPPVCGVSPALYTRVSSYVDWIEEIVWQYDD